MFNFKASPIEDITPQQAEQKMKSGKVLLIDVREPYEYAQVHIDGAKSLPLGKLTAQINQVCEKEQELVLVCQSGSRSSYAAQQLSNLGYKKIYNLRGGTVAWLLAGLPAIR